MKLNNHALALIAVGASVSANCQPCLEHNVKTARECGADDQEIAEAIDIGKRVRQGAAAKMDKFAISLKPAVPTATNATGNGCGCSSPITSSGENHA
ncbi:MAG: carboxymuconolactone decarboxylase family protein [Chloroflexota bacterium]